ncbi:MAG: 6-phosphogluconolactonase [Solirubrobacteraceae bacterium]
MTRLTTCADAEAVAARAARDIARHLDYLRAEHDVLHVALSGGTTPTRTYELLAREQVDWAGVEIWFADERCVEPTDAQSNYRLAHETLLAAVAIPPVRVHRMEGELGPLRGAQRYSTVLAAHLPAGEGGLPVLDLVVLGIGPDGHVASLFPGAATLDAGDEALCLGVRDSPKPPAERITLSLAMLRAARRCLLLATGAGKADAVNAMLAQPSRSVPASLLRRERLAVIVDDAACPTSLKS